MYNHLNTFLRLSVIAAAVYAPASMACSMMPVNVQDQVEDMRRFALTALNVEAQNVERVEVREATGDYIWQNPMCPEGVQASATYYVSYNNPKDPLTKGCTGVVKVSKTQPTGLAEIPVPHMYTTEIVQAGICLESVGR